MVYITGGRLAGGGTIEFNLLDQDPPCHPAEESAVRAVALLPQEPLGKNRGVLPGETWVPGHTARLRGQLPSY